MTLNVYILRNKQTYCCWQCKGWLILSILSEMSIKWSFEQKKSIQYFTAMIFLHYQISFCTVVWVWHVPVIVHGNQSKLCRTRRGLVDEQVENPCSQLWQNEIRCFKNRILRFHKIVTKYVLMISNRNANYAECDPAFVQYWINKADYFDRNFVQFFFLGAVHK